MRGQLPWGAAIALLGLGTALVFGAVIARGLFLAGVVLIDVGLLVLTGAALLTLRRVAED